MLCLLFSADTWNVSLENLTLNCVIVGIWTVVYAKYVHLSRQDREHFCHFREFLCTHPAPTPRQETTVLISISRGLRVWKDQVARQGCCLVSKVPAYHTGSLGFGPTHQINWGAVCRSLIPAPERWREEDQTFKAFLSFPDDSNQCNLPLSQEYKGKETQTSNKRFLSGCLFPSHWPFFIPLPLAARKEKKLQEKKLPQR